MVTDLSWVYCFWARAQVVIRAQPQLNVNWIPTGPGLTADLDGMDYAKA
jgi:hypothetical protein